MNAVSSGIQIFFPGLVANTITTEGTKER